jgi:hypothetical protein
LIKKGLVAKMRGLQGNTQHTDFLTAVQRKTFERLAEIEQEDCPYLIELGWEMQFYERRSS